LNEAGLRGALNRASGAAFEVDDGRASAAVRCVTDDHLESDLGSTGRAVDLRHLENVLVVNTSP